MKEFKGTHGPWDYQYNRIQPSYSSGEVNDKDGNLLAIISGSNYGTSFGGPNRDWEGEFDDDDEHEANAKLIASSPDLLSALQNLVEIYDDKSGKVWTTSSKRRALDAAHAAIDKALGESK